MSPGTSAVGSAPVSAPQIKSKQCLVDQGLLQIQGTMPVFSAAPSTGLSPSRRRAVHAATRVLAVFQSNKLAAVNSDDRQNRL